MSYWADMSLFFGKIVILAIMIILVLMMISAVMRKIKLSAPFKEGHLVVQNLSQLFAERKDYLRNAVIEKKVLKKLRKKEKKAEKNVEKEELGKLFVIDFHGDIKASATGELSKEISAILSVATQDDEILLRLESMGGMVHAYGFATAQLERIVEKNIRLVVAVDKVAASGGYMMACVANHLISAPFAVIGSIGVIGQLPNIHRLLKKNDIDIEQHTSGEFKRTLTVLGKNTEKGREKFIEDLEKTHIMFMEHVNKYRKLSNISTVSTGEIWYGQEAVQKQLVDELGTSEVYIANAIDNGQKVYHVKWEMPKKSLLNRLSKNAVVMVRNIQDSVIEKISGMQFFS